MGASLKMIAEAAGVSQATASLALNNRPGVNGETRAKVCALAKRMGYIPSVSAKNLSRRQTGLVGLVVPNLSNIVYSTFVRGIEGELRERGYRTIIAASESNRDYERQMIEHFVSFRVEGAIIYPVIKDNPDTEYLRLLRMNDIPMVFLGGYYRGVRASHVMSDIYSGIAAAAEHLRARGGKSFYYFGGCPRIVSNELKIRAVRDVLAAGGIPFGDDRYVELAGSGYDFAYKTAKAFFAERRDADSVFAPDAYSALAIYNALVESGLRVPEDVSLISFDNLVPPEACKVRLTCIEQNIPEIVRSAVDELFSKIAGNRADKSILVQTRLVLRDTTDNAPLNKA